MSEPTIERFTFTAAVTSSSGTLYLPADQPVAAVVTTGPAHLGEGAGHRRLRAGAGGTGLRRARLRPSDVRGERGEPRQFEHPEGKAADVPPRSTALGADERTRDLPVVAVGVCAGGGYMAQAVADDARASRAFAGVAGYYSDAAAFAESSPDAYQAAIDRGRRRSGAGERRA